ncbi:hypothetical protein BROC_00081 [Candidatus Brocadiaceae bacterium]|nr:hypothetical protein BROC_00081 [Candidatus Brocadiaceae bacterium]
MAKKKKKWLSTKIIFQKDPTYYPCPKCGKINVLKRSRPRSLSEKVIRASTFWKIYRCHNCSWRGYRSRVMITWQSFFTLMVYIIVALLAGLIVLQYLKSQGN